MTLFTGKGVDVFRAAVIKSALDLYRKHGIKANRAYTPKAMMAAASDITGLTFKPRAYLTASIALGAWIEKAKAEAYASGEIKADPPQRKE